MGLNKSLSVEINRELFPVKVIPFIVSLLRTVAAATYYISKLRHKFKTLQSRCICDRHHVNIFHADCSIKSIFY